jgi:hypothetical protein
MAPILLFAAALAAQPAEAAAEPAPVLPEGPALTQAIMERDTALFATFFEQCDPEAIRAMIAEDLEMYHDRDGIVALSADEFVTAYRRNCESRTPEGWHSRRQLVPESLVVWPVPGLGAIEEGEHLFYERRGDGPERLAGRARFLQLWRLTGDGWKLARIFSHGHEAAEEPAAE